MATKKNGGFSAKLAGLGVLGGRSVLIIAAIVLAAVVSFRLDLRLDWSANRYLTLDPVLVDAISELKQPTRLIGIWPEASNQPIGQRQAAVGTVIQPTIDNMVRHSTQLSWTHVDNEVELPLMESLRSRYDGIRGPGLYVVRAKGDDQGAFRIPLHGGLVTRLQREIGGALINLRNTKQQPVLLIQGHGELRPGAHPGNSANILVDNFKLAGFTVAPFDAKTLAEFGRLPAEAIVVVAGPTSPLGDQMLQALDNHLRDGGAMLVLGDHRMGPKLSDLLRQRGIVLGAHHNPVLRDGVLTAIKDGPVQPPHLLYSQEHSVGRDGSFHRLVLNPQRSFFGDEFDIMATSRNEGRLANSTASIPVRVADPRLFPDQAEALLEALQQHQSPAPQASPLLTLPQNSSWVGSPTPQQIPPQNLNATGQYVLAWALQYPREDGSATQSNGARVIVWGSRQAASDAILGGENYANGQLLTDMMQWLSNRSDQVRIPPTSFQAFRVDAEEGTLTRLLAILVAIIPCCMLGVAMIAWWERR
jgi:hypothetical protein